MSDATDSTTSRIAHKLPVSSGGVVEPLAGFLGGTLAFMLAAVIIVPGNTSMTELILVSGVIAGVVQVGGALGRAILRSSIGL